MRGPMERRRSAPYGGTKAQGWDCVDIRSASPTHGAPERRLSGSMRRPSSGSLHRDAGFKLASDEVLEVASDVRSLGHSQGERPDRMLHQWHSLTGDSDSDELDGTYCSGSLAGSLRRSMHSRRSSAPSQLRERARSLSGHPPPLKRGPPSPLERRGRDRGHEQRMRLRESRDPARPQSVLHSQGSWDARSAGSLRSYHSSQQLGRTSRSWVSGSPSGSPYYQWQDHLSAQSGEGSAVQRRRTYSAGVMRSISQDGRDHPRHSDPGAGTSFPGGSAVVSPEGGRKLRAHPERDTWRYAVLAGEEVTVLDESPGGWAFVMRMQAPTQRGWIRACHLRPSVSAATPQPGLPGRVTAQGGRRLRVAPGSEAYKHHVVEGETVQVLQMEAHWVKVRRAGGEEGWLRRAYVAMAASGPMLSPSPPSAQAPNSAPYSARTGTTGLTSVQQSPGTSPPGIPTPAPAPRLSPRELPTPGHFAPARAAAGRPQSDDTASLTGSPARRVATPQTPTPVWAPAVGSLGNMASNSTGGPLGQSTLTSARTLPSQQAGSARQGIAPGGMQVIVELGDMSDDNETPSDLDDSDDSSPCTPTPEVDFQALAALQRGSEDSVPTGDARARDYALREVLRMMQVPPSSASRGRPLLEECLQAAERSSPA
eukprot:TRINITY_DN55873_c0_g1_i1.p1 TRINITY_DN55873_c0_g1~~TRINITY_DN55873_c0_g1_i1.p1  ORF type:complete len:680 (+),score=129.58 TRINITY_DN55873_c0_g1_i1:86-2041(+)